MKGMSDRLKNILLNLEDTRLADISGVKQNKVRADVAERLIKAAYRAGVRDTEDAVGVVPADHQAFKDIPSHLL